MKDKIPYKNMKVKNQLPQGFLLLLIIIGLSFYLNNKSSKLTIYFLIGCGFGFILEKSRFCFTAAFRDPYLTGSTALTRAVLIAFALTSIGFTLIKYYYKVEGLSVPGMNYVVPISLATAVGAFVFGIGMVISGGCASGTFMRLGEGFQLQIVTLFFFVLGSLWGARDYEWWHQNFISKGVRIFLPDVFGWFGGLLVNLMIITLLYIGAKKWEEKKL